MLDIKKLRFLHCRTKNAIKYSLKRNIITDELYKWNSLAHGGYLSWRTYANVVHKEVKTRIRNKN